MQVSLQAKITDGIFEKEAIVKTAHRTRDVQGMAVSNLVASCIAPVVSEDGESSYLAPQKEWKTDTIVRLTVDYLRIS